MIEPTKFYQEQAIQKANYKNSDLKGLDDAELLKIIKTCWGYVESEPFEVIGKIVKINSQYRSFYILENLINIDFEKLEYPLDVVKNPGLHIGFELGVDFSVGDWVKAEVRLAPILERVKHDNYLELNVNPKSMTKLVKIPKDLWEQRLSRNSQYIEQWLIDFLADNKADEIRIRTNQLIDDIKVEKEEVVSTLNNLKQEYYKSKSNLESNIEIIQRQNVLIKNNDEELILKQNLIVEAELELSKIFENKENIVNRLNEFIKNKAKLLHDLDIVDEKLLNQITGSWQPVEDVREGHSLSENFSNIEEAIAYVQAYLHNKGIMYRREVLENFYTLLRTRDLIILAGDSGAGKTNLVKSFAEAIGGKSFIIPVKPNWTGAEDLLGYYNPIEQSYLSTQFLDALIEAEKNPQVPHFICLDEMNLARVEYYFADFLSLLEDRGHAPVVHLYSQSESSHLLSEMKNFLALIHEARDILDKNNIETFVDILKDEELNKKLHELCGFKDGDSLLKYHARLRKSFASYIDNPSSLVIPENVFFIGAINIDETTHYLSPKILDRAHIMRFVNPLLQDWGEIEEQIENFLNLDITKPVLFDIADFGFKKEYPVFELDGELEQNLIHITKNYLIPLGVEFGLRSIRQAKNYLLNYQTYFDISEKKVLNNVVRQKIMPKLMFDGTKKITETKDRKDILIDLRVYLEDVLSEEVFHPLDDCVQEINTTLTNAEINDWVVNYWFK
ncbi:McrB family protein [Oligella urethralis]|uniref:AAA domain (Dynein-related subfamily) n=1 Tax=Oligella urethralis TaxID=90245 RepID=A0A2X1UNE2_9BURK|nr:AAA family ATPase [Oligella urethralis]SPY08609.1 AAA domain (dynein-related subfamily) [Oligella urethralis]